jgi:hypothetical protein
MKRILVSIRICCSKRLDGMCRSPLFEIQPVVFWRAEDHPHAPPSAPSRPIKCCCPPVTLRLLAGAALQDLVHRKAPVQVKLHVWTGEMAESKGDVPAVVHHSADSSNLGIDRYLVDGYFVVNG